jgi:hypothetical protein
MNVSSRYALFGLVLAGTLLLGVSADAQLGGLIKKKLPKLPIPDAVKPAAPANAPRKYCGSITDELLDRFLKALEAENAVAAKRQEAERRIKAQAEEARQRADSLTPAGFAKFEACKDAALAKDPRTKERDRLRGLADAAARRVETRRYQEYSSQADELSELMDAAAEKACGGGPKALFAGGGASEEAANRAAAESIAKDTGDPVEAGKQAGGFTEEEYARLKECVIGRLATPKTTPTTPESEAAIDKRAAELEKALPVK